MRKKLKPSIFIIAAISALSTFPYVAAENITLLKNDPIQVVSTSFVGNTETQLYDEKHLDSFVGEGKVVEYSQNTGIVQRVISDDSSSNNLSNKNLDTLIEIDKLADKKEKEYLTNRVVSPIGGNRIITSPFGQVRYIFGRYDVHNGVDFVNGDNNTPIMAYKYGTVHEVVLNDSAGGVGVVIKHLDGKYSYYWHLAEGSVSVSEGQVVEAGEKIGIIGNTGISTGTHLHFSLSTGYWSGFYDPMTEL